MNGNKKPTVKQLVDLSKKVYLPFGYFLLTEPPKETLPIPFFRTQNTTAQQVSVNVYDTILLLKQRQDWLKEYLKDSEHESLPFVGKFQNNRKVSEVVSDIRETLGLSKNWASEFKTWQEALDSLIKHVENVGIVTMFNGIVENNTHRPIQVDECRGFVLVDEFAPFMFVNNSDAKAAQLFTIVHELAHIWIGQSAAFDFRKLEPANNPIEQICDKIAAEFLVPATSFCDLWDKQPSIIYLAKFFKVSEIVIARRALDMNKISKAQFIAFYDDYINREFTKKETQASGGDFYATTRKRLGLAFSTHINTAVKSGKLLYRDAYKLTSLKGDTFQTYFSKHI
ncbi:MAG TPA: ImmA/IrrE family metallo-endopeptidase [Bacteroidales bacterium]|nr:ImmA/IrrE family metallo-endopeptidase [Bacteroidales bacterium]